MKNLCYLFCLTLILLTGCDPHDGKGILSPPIIEPTLLQCATVVTVKGFIPGAEIKIYANGTSLIGSGISNSPWGQTFSVDPALTEGQVITATQTFDGLTSPPSPSLTVESSKSYFGGDFPKAKLNEPIYECGGAVAVSNLAKGGQLKVYTDEVEVGHINGCGESQWLTVNPVFLEGKSVTADVTLCADVFPLSDPVIVLAEPTSLPQLEIGDIYENGKYCVIHNVTNGAKVKVYNGDVLIREQYYSGGSQQVRLSPQVVPGDIITATQEFCNVKSDPSDPSIVKPCSELPAPKLGAICAGALSVKIIDAVLDAHIKVYRDGVLVANGGGNEIMLFAPSKHGENYSATQSLLDCISPLSVAIAVGCDGPTLMKPDIPYAGRAVSVAVNPDDDDNIIVASETGGLFRSTNKGENWVQVSRSTTFKYTDLTYLRFAKDVIIATARNDSRTIGGGGIWRSTNAGSTWKRIAMTTPDVNCMKNITAYCLSVDGEGKRIWAGTSCGLAYSDNAGKDWTFQAVVPGYRNESVYSVETPDSERIVIVTNKGISVSDDGGANFKLAMDGIPDDRWGGDHNQIAIAPNDAEHIYWAINYIRKSDSVKFRSLYRSLDFGANWSPAFEVEGNRNRPLFVRTAWSLNEKTDNYDVYWGDGARVFQRATATTGSSSTMGSWTQMTIDHADPADVGFENDNKTPLLLLTDGGLHKTTDKGENWKLTGGGPHGYNALQITEVTGQLHENGESADLYFATQDNSIWASPDLGQTWPTSRCCEGFFLNIMREYYPPEQTRLTGVYCGPCRNFISKPLLDEKIDFSNPPQHRGNPRLLKPDHYIQNAYPYDSIGSLFMLTKNTGTSWDSSFVFTQDVKALPKLSGNIHNPVIFTAFKAGGVTPSGAEILNIKRITGVLDAGGPIVSDITGFGSLGTFPTMFAWYKPFEIDPRDPNFIIVADIIDNFVKISTDGGASWEKDSNLTDLITGYGEFNFSWGGNGFTQLSTIGFDPDCPNHIMVGTQQAGIFVTYNRGKTWGKVFGSERLPYVSSFFFAGNNKVIISTYGRGLWSMNYTCSREDQDDQKKTYTISQQNPKPFIWHGQTRIPLSSITNPASMPNSGYFLVKGGDIVDYSIDQKSKELEEVVLSSGEIQAYSWDGNILKVPFKVRIGEGQGYYGGDKQVSAMVNNKLKVKGLLLENNKFKAPIFYSKDITTDQLPKQEPLRPYISILNESGGLTTVEDRDPIYVAVRNFDPNLKLEVYLDGELVKLVPEPRMDKSGSTKLKIPQSVGVGGHTLLVKQQDGDKVLQDVDTFQIRVIDKK